MDYKQTLKLSTLLALPLLLTSCAQHLSQEDCMAHNMYQLGVMDGNSGKSINQFSRYQSDCNEYNIELDQKQYQSGWNKGNLSYCQPALAFSLGRAGKSYPLVCTDNSGSGLRRAYERGFQIHQRIEILESRLHGIDKELNATHNVEQKMDDVRHRLSVKRAERDSAKSQEIKNEKTREIEDLEAELDMLKTRLVVSAAVGIARDKELRKEKTDIERELDRLRAKR